MLRTAGVRCLRKKPPFALITQQEKVPETEGSKSKSGRTWLCPHLPSATLPGTQKMGLQKKKKTQKGGVPWYRVECLEQAL